jgi:hypothetical protein
MKITGLDKFAREMDELAKFSKAIDGNLVTVKYNPDDPASVQAAIWQMETAVDAKAAPYRSNKLVIDLASKSKEQFRQAIRSRK